jgi:eukaryotic-like serine/threonine-protein kinase
MTTDFNIGCMLANRYQITDLLGRGSMGRVYAAKDVLLGGVPVAVKVLSQSLLTRKMRDRFEREATTCALLGQKSIHIVRVTDYGIWEDDEVPFYVMEYLKGESLGQLVSREPLSLPRFLSLTRQICLGLQCAHQGILVENDVYPIVHRDIKPSNIMIIQDNSLGELAKILDFGIAKLLQADSGQTSCFMGTLAYSSPEQMEGRELDPRSDIYSLGIMMFQLLTGKMPLQADTHTFGGWYKAHQFQHPCSFTTANIAIKIPKALETLVMSCLSKSPNDRPQNVAAILKALEPLEQRFGPGQQIGHQIGAALSKLPVTAAPLSERRKTSRSSDLSADEICRLSSWPKNMPIADIVFPKPIRTTSEVLSTLWIMLPQREIQKRLVCTRYNQFLFLEAPHPMVLWLTVLYEAEHGPRWLPCYLDLKSSQGAQMAKLLGKTGQYRLLFFAHESPQRCMTVMTSTIAEAQCRMLQQWVVASQSVRSTGQSATSKTMLKNELEKLKPKIVMKLEALYSSDNTDISG